MSISEFNKSIHQMEEMSLQELDAAKKQLKAKLNGDHSDESRSTHQDTLTMIATEINNRRLIESPSATKCFWCDGTGITYWIYAVEDCYDCNGSGVHL